MELKTTVLNQTFQPLNTQNSVRYRGVRYIEALPKLAYFTSKTYSGVLGY